MKTELTDKELTEQYSGSPLITVTGSIKDFDKLGNNHGVIIQAPADAKVTYLQPNGKPRKVIVMMVAKNFFKGHPRAGEPTGFHGMLCNLAFADNFGKLPEHLKNILLKLHTIRAGEYWKKVVDKVNAGTHVLSLRYWSEQPYKSKQVEFMEFTRLGYQEIEIDVTGKKPVVKIDGIERVSSLLTTIALNDGLSRDNFNAWFGIAYTYTMPNGSWATKYRKLPYYFKGGIIHFTDFRY